MVLYFLDNLPQKLWLEIRGGQIKKNACNAVMLTMGKVHLNNRPIKFTKLPTEAC